MILPQVFKVLNVPAVRATGIGAGTEQDPTRIYRHGYAPQGVVKPYITWFVVAGQPYDQISGAPDADFDTVQIDCWSPDDTQVGAIATAVRDALDAAGLTNRLVVDRRESETGLNRIGIESDFIRSR
jgi:hypothetical protein